MADQQIEPAFIVGGVQGDGSILVSCAGELDVMFAQSMRDAFLHPDVPAPTSR